MIVTMRQWYDARSVRERWLLLAMLAIAMALVAWLLVIVPLRATYASALERHLAAVDRHGRVLALTEMARKSPARPTAAQPAGDIALIVGDSARAAGLVLNGSTAAGERGLDVTMSKAAPSTALGWLGGLERIGYRVEQLRVSPGADGTVAVSARLSRTGQ